MDTVFNETMVKDASRTKEIDTSRPAYQAYQVLRIGFTIAPIAAGLDKFFHLLVNWDQYLPAFVNNLTGGHGHELMLVAGVIEIIAGLGVWLMPKIFAYVVSAWLLLIVANLLMIPGWLWAHSRSHGSLRMRKDSPNTVRRNESFRGYADYMEMEEFKDGIERLLDFAVQKRTAVMFFVCHRPNYQHCLRRSDYCRD